jgi:hypothetical protein
MSDQVNVAERETQLLLEAAKQLRESLLKSETVYRRTLKGLHRRMGVTATIKANQAELARRELTEALKEFEHQRHRTRVSIISAQLAQGDSIADVGRSWGFSRQLASKYAQEATVGLDSAG